MGEKTEEATPKKLRDARKKGQVTKSQDVPSAATFIASFAMILVTGSFMSKELSAMIVNSFKAINRTDHSYIAGYLIFEGLRKVVVISLPICVVSAFIGVVANFIMIGPLLTFEVFKPDFKKLDPIQGLKNKFNLKTFFEVGKSLLKIGLAIYLIYTVVKEKFVLIAHSAKLSFESSIELYANFLYEVMKKIGVLFIFVAIVDYIFQKRQFANSMKMEKHEIKQEYKNTEGDPQIKGKRREMAKEIAMGDNPTKNVKRSKAVVVNPTHIAVAIDYVPEKGISAPFITAMGIGLNAAAIIREAKKFEVPVIRNITLARLLFYRGKLYDFIPEETFTAVAEVLLWISSMKKNNKINKLNNGYLL